MGLRIGIFAADVGGSHAAAMVAGGLAAIGRMVAVAAPEFRPGGDVPAATTGRVSTIALPDRVNAFEIQSLLERFALRHGDSIVALPLVALGDPAVRIQFDAVIVVGRDHAAAEMALAAARHRTGEAIVRGGPPAWFLACEGQHGLRTLANLRPDRGPGLPFAVRALPAAMPRLSKAKGTALLEGHPDLEAVRDGILLAVLVVAMAADPHAGRVDGSTLAHLMAARDLDAERRTSDLLARLGAEYERTEDALVDRVAARHAAGRTTERRPLATGRRAARVAGRTVGLDVVRHDAARRTP